MCAILIQKAWYSLYQGTNMQCHRNLSSRQSCLKLIDARLFPGPFQRNEEAVPFSLRALLRPEFLYDPKEFISVSFAHRAKALDCCKNLGDIILSIRAGDFMLGARLKTVTQILQLLAHYVEFRNVGSTSRSGCADFEGAFDETGCE